jgi:hypothetical protein
MIEVARNHGSASELPDQSCDSGSNPSAAKYGRLRALAHRIYRDDRKLQLALLAFMLLFYGALLFAARGQSARTTPLRLTFNSMLAHLMQGRFDVDLAVVGWEEGFLRAGRVYPYFGIWPALLRLPLWIFHRMDIDLTPWSVLAAVCLAGMAKVRAVLLLRRHGMRSPIAGRATGLMLAYVLLVGSAIGQLNPSVYEEVILWAYAFAAVFVYFAVKGIVNRGFGVGTLCGMALCAGLALLTRVSTGIGVVVAMVLLLLVLAAEPYAAQCTAESADFAAGRRSPVRRFLRALAARCTLLPAGILAALMAATGTVNYFRWGNPATFANWDLYLGWSQAPDILERMHTYGTFNIVRIPFNLVYYFFPFWVVHATNSDLLLEGRWGRTLAAIELPPGSFLLTDMLALCFIALLTIALWKRRSRGLPPAGRWALAVAIGLLAPCILMLTAMWVAYRYRMEFYPEIEFLAFLGLYLTVTDSGALALFTRLRKWMTAALTISIACSFFVLFLVDVGQSLPPDMGGQGLVRFYVQVTEDHFHKIMVRHFTSHP